ncbi:MAG: type IV pilus assembly protein PilM [Candidatus Yanofskybacteria bacterium]|nr:type IV pilus assembly protein PilM [Candidatus Yanofskybacteria bacterium]
MNFGFFKNFLSKGTLGIDIGTASIKVAELSRESGHFKLLNYGIFQLENQEEAIETKQKITKLPDQDIVWGIKELISRSGVKSKNVVASIPSFSTFSTTISLPYLSEKDLAKAIPFEAKKYVPIPIDEVILDWSIINLASDHAGGGQALAGGRVTPTVEVFLAAVPKHETERYKKIMTAAGLNLAALELENIALIRSLIGNDLSPVAIVNIGGRSTSILVVDRGFERISHNYEIGGFEITKSIARSMGVSLSRAEEFKRTVGLKSDSTKVVGEAMISLLDMIVFESKKTITTYENNKGAKIQKVFLSGGVANMPSFLEYFKSKINLETAISNPFVRVVYPKELAKMIPELSPTFSIAVGLAMREV